MSQSLNPLRTDFAVPFAIDAASGQAAQADYATHVDQMIRQILLTDPGERVCLPRFGAGLRRLLFSPVTAQLQASATIVITQALNAYLANQITVKNVAVQTSASTPGLADGTVIVTISYVLIELQLTRQTAVQVGPSQVTS
jgi:phage baseplate assembly protein W